MTEPTKIIPFEDFIKDELLESCGGAMALKCPICNFLYTHIDSVSITDANKNSINIECKNEDEKCDIKIDTKNKLKEKIYTRRHVIMINGSCENGCNFSFVFNQHKGLTIDC